VFIRPFVKIFKKEYFLMIYARLLERGGEGRGGGGRGEEGRELLILKIKYLSFYYIFVKLETKFEKGGKGRGRRGREKRIPVC